MSNDAMTECRICGQLDCDDDCEELHAIYREQQREKLRDIDVDEIIGLLLSTVEAHDQPETGQVLRKSVGYVGSASN